MRMSMGVRVALILLAVVLGLTALIVLGVEREYGGQEAIEGIAKGYLPNQLVEVRDVDWALDTEASGDYELAVEGNDAVIRLVEGDGGILFTGPPDEAGTWLDEQGSRQYLGANDDADAYLNDLRDSAKSYTGAIVLGLAALGLLIVAVVPNRQARQTPTPTPAPTI